VDAPCKNAAVLHKNLIKQEAPAAFEAEIPLAEEGDGVKNCFSMCFAFKKKSNKTKETHVSTT
jgi:hypothetical protein